jgi:5-methylcytosine-specific restriction protein A
MTTPPSNWTTSTRRPDPPYWKALRHQVIVRANGLCEFIYEAHPIDPAIKRCNYKANEVDHIINLASGGTDDMSNLQLLCTYHHKQKTAQEAAKARKPKTERKPREAHPGWN